MDQPAFQVKPPQNSIIEVGPVPKSTPDSNQATATIQNLGCVRIGKEELADLECLGLYVRSVGTVQIVRGKLLINGQRLSAAIQALTEVLLRLGEKAQKTKNDYTSMARLSDSLARLYAQQTEIQRLLIELEKISPREDPPRALTPCFEPGKPVYPVYPWTVSKSLETSEPERSPTA